MKILLFVGVTLVAVSLHSSAGEDGQVTLSLADYLAERQAAAEIRASDEPPIGEAVTKAVVELAVSEGRLEGSASFEVATYSEGWHVVPLIGGAISVLGITPGDASVVTHEGRLALQVRGEIREEIVVNFESVSSDGEGWDLDLPGVVSGTVRAAAPPEGSEVSLKSREGRVVGRSVILPTGPSRIEVALVARSEVRELPRLETDTATVAVAEYRTRVVADGSLLCEARVKLQHRDEVGWQFRIPGDSQLLTCAVGGVATRPIIVEPGLLELPVPAAPGGADAGTVLTFSYTARVEDFDPVRGDLEVELPSTPLFVETIDWQLTLPEGYEASAFEGNVEVAPEGNERTLHFQKSLARGDAPTVQIYYVKTQLR